MQQATTSSNLSSQEELLGDALKHFVLSGRGSDKMNYLEEAQTNWTIKDALNHTELSVSTRLPAFHDLLPMLRVMQLPLRNLCSYK